MARRPVNAPYRITTEFGVPDSYALFKRHSGVDYAVPTGTNVYAPISGTVTYANEHRVRGWMVTIFDGTYTHRLMHNSVLKVAGGYRVTEGQIVALSGSTGLSTGPHVHWDIIRGNKVEATSFADFVDPAAWLASAAPKPAPVQDVLQPYQRRVGASGSNRRSAPSLTASVINEFPANDVVDFKGYVKGEAYSGNDIWFVGRYTGGYCWSGSFTNPGIAGLPDITESTKPTLEPYQRQVRPDDSINYRKQPNTSAEIIDTWPVNDIANFKGWVNGEPVEGNNVWFVGRFSDGYAWSGGFTNPSTSGLEDLNTNAPVPPTTQYSTKPSIPGTWMVDVSNHQKSLDFNQLKAHGIEGVIMKVGHTGKSYGGDERNNDPLFATFQRDARAAGLPVGYYWYCYFDEDPVKEAQNFVNSLGSRIDGEPLFADIEHDKPPANEAWVKTFVQTVEQLSGQWCHIYSYTHYIKTFPWILNFVTEGRKLWLAHYDIPAGTQTYNPVMHQYTSSGVLPGVGSTYIDLNMFYGTTGQFKQLGNLVVQPNPNPEPDKDPVPVDEPPAPLPTPDNNPVRPKVKAAVIAGLVLTALQALAQVFGFELPQTNADDAALVATGLTTIITFVAAYMKRDGLSPK